jgi:hypothetical protein
MQVTAVAEVRQSCATVAVTGHSAEALAIAASLASAGHQVRCLSDEPVKVSRCEFVVGGPMKISSSAQVKLAGTSGDANATLRGADAIVIPGDATKYGEIIDQIAAGLNSGQTIFLHNAAFGAAFEFSFLLDRRRDDLTVNIVEMGPLFQSAELSRNSVVMVGQVARPVIGGRTVNETRVGLSVGSFIWDGLVPASNLLERGFARKSQWLKACALLFELLAKAELEPSKGRGGDRRAAGQTTAGVQLILSNLSNEIDTLARGFRITADASQPPVTCGGQGTDKRTLLRNWVTADFVVLSELARVAHVGVPVLDSIIDLSSVITGTDLRKNGRKLESLGLIGVDAAEISELMNA